MNRRDRITGGTSILKLSLICTGIIALYSQCHSKFLKCLGNDFDDSRKTDSLSKVVFKYIHDIFIAVTSGYTHPYRKKNGYQM